MQIHYFGLSSFKITTKEATVITDPFDKESGLTPPRGAAEVIVLAEKANKLYTATSGISGEPFLINDPGEYDVKGVTVTGIPLKQNRSDAGAAAAEEDDAEETTKSGSNRYVTVFLIESEDIKILDLTHIRQFSMKQDDLEDLGEIDILILPVGGNSVMTAREAAKVVNEVEPKIVIPCHYDMTGLKLPYDKLNTFIKEMGGKSESMDKLLIKKKDLVEDVIKVIVLEPLR